MLRHIVTYKFLPEAQGRTKAENLEIARGLAAEMGKSISVLKAFRCGTGCEGQKADNYDIILICDLDDLDALAEYKQHPAHKAFGTHCHAVSSGRAAIDFEI
ncbi:MAG: Dabb family protein [Oscillospiraceae bacterium]|nr:Dabb family protein [Oscillospiraceae bacterium]